jgi:signal transduction histidine kinase
MKPRLETAGLRVVWRVADDVPLPVLGSELTLDLLRIVQEAFTNVLKHAGAGSVEVAIGAGSGGGGFCVTIRDDGGGIRPGATDGHGLANMRRRTQRLGATLEIESSPSGTTISIALPAAVASASGEGELSVNRESAARGSFARRPA